MTTPVKAPLRFDIRRPNGLRGEDREMCVSQDGKWVAYSWYEALEQQLGNLLATIHCDGGHHQAAVGIEQAVKDAIAVWDRLPRDAEGRLVLVQP